MPLDVPEQKRHLCGVVGAAVGQHVGGDLTGAGGHGEMQLAPVPSGPAVLGGISLTLAEQLQTHAVQHEVDRARVRQRPRTPAGRRPSTPAERGVVRIRQIEPQQAQDAADECLGLAQGQVEDEAQRQHAFDRQVGVDRLAAWRASLRSRPASNSGLFQPQREIAASPQSGLVRWPVHDAVAGGRDAMATSGIVLERHARKVAVPSASRHRRPPCTTAAPIDNSPDGISPHWWCAPSARTE